MTLMVAVRPSFILGKKKEKKKKEETPHVNFLKILYNFVKL